MLETAVTGQEAAPAVAASQPPVASLQQSATI